MLTEVVCSSYCWHIAILTSEFLFWPSSDSIFIFFCPTSTSVVLCLIKSHVAWSTCFVTIYRYPRITEENVAKKCPFCCNICNCTACLRLDYKIEVRFLFSTISCLVIIFDLIPLKIDYFNTLQGISSDPMFSKDEQKQYSEYTVRMLLHHLREINDEQIAEKKIEAKISGNYFCL